MRLIIFFVFLLFVSCFGVRKGCGNFTVSVREFDGRMSALKEVRHVAWALATWLHICGGNPAKGWSNRMNRQVLIPVFIDVYRGGFAQFVDAESLHVFLQCQDVFSEWVFDRIERCGFEEGCDFIINSPRVDRFDVQHVRYRLTLDMAKAMSVIEGSSKGREARRYFLEIEHDMRPSFCLARKLITHETCAKEGCITAFRIGEASLRVIYREHGWWFVATDVGKALRFHGHTVKLLRDLRASDVACEIIDGEDELLASEAGMYTIFECCKGVKVEAVRDWFVTWLIPHLRTDHSWR